MLLVSLCFLADGWWVLSCVVLAGCACHRALCCQPGQGRPALHCCAAGANPDQGQLCGAGGSHRHQGGWAPAYTRCTPFNTERVLIVCARLLPSCACSPVRAGPALVPGGVLHSPSQSTCSSIPDLEQSYQVALCMCSPCAGHLPPLPQPVRDHHCPAV